MAEKRVKNAGFCLKIGAKSIKFELFDSTQWADGTPGCVRVRINGRWHDGPAGESVYLHPAGVAAMVADLLSGMGLPEPPQKPTVRKGQRISLPIQNFVENGVEYAGGTESGSIWFDQTMLGHDGRYYVCASGVFNRPGFYPYDSHAMGDSNER